MPLSICVFDAYGTLFDVAAAARIAATEPGAEQWREKWPQIAADWRLKQLQYTWLRAVADRHTDFWQVTQDGLDFALEQNGLGQNAALRQRLLDLYWQLEAYAEVPDMLRTLKSNGARTAILSNGSPDMLSGAVQSAELSDILDAVLSVQSVGIFKPAAPVYQMVCDHFTCTASEVLFVSSNGWDAAGAADFGFQTVWVNRAQEPVDRLYAKPRAILSDLTQIPELAAQWG